MTISADLGRQGMRAARDRRLLLGDAAILSVEETCELLPISEADAKAWLKAQKLILKTRVPNTRRGGGSRIVQTCDWGDVRRRWKRAPPEVVKPTVIKLAPKDEPWDR